jgi:hypothetical protein
MTPIPDHSAQVTYVAAKSRAYVLALVLLASALLLIAIGRDDRNVALLYFMGYPFATLAVVGLLFLLFRKPAQITVARDFILISGQRYAAADIVVGEQEYREHGQATFRVFSLTTMAPDGRMQEHEINAFAWPQFEELHQRLRKLAPGEPGASPSAGEPT